jgi:hypothetical protein
MAVVRSDGCVPGSGRVPDDGVAARFAASGHRCAQLLIEDDGIGHRDISPVISVTAKHGTPHSATAAAIRVVVDMAGTSVRGLDGRRSIGGPAVGLQPLEWVTPKRGTYDVGGQFMQHPSATAFLAPSRSIRVRFFQLVVVTIAQPAPAAFPERQPCRVRQVLVVDTAMMVIRPVGQADVRSAFDFAAVDGTDQLPFLRDTDPRSPAIRVRCADVAVLRGADRFDFQ